MNQKELKLLFKKSEKVTPFERLICKKVSFDDVSLDKIKTFLSEAKIKIDDINSKKILNSLNLSIGSRINNAGVMFFSKKPRQHIFHCEMMLAAFKGTDRVHIYDRLNVQDDLITQFNEAMLFLKRHLNVRSEIRGVNRYDIYEIPLEALREAVANAIIHRDYSMSGTSLMVEVHEDRVSIKNPEGLPAGMDMKLLMHTSVRRNELIADIFSRIDKAERMASGLPRIMRLMSEADLLEPVIESNTFFEIIFKRDKRYTSATEYPEATVDIKSEKLSARQVEILQILQDRKLAPTEIIDALLNPASPRTLSRDLQVLKDKGYIDTEGPRGWGRKWFLRK